MQKKFIALAVAGLVSGAAFAQSNVTVYGVVDTSFDVVQSSGSATSGDNFSSFNRVSANSSYIGFKGTEALGNGLNAVFQIETGVDVSGNANSGLNSGTGSTQLFSGMRDTFGGISGGFGTVVLGTLTGPTRALGAAVDVNAGATGIGANSGLLGKIAGNTISNNGCGKSSTCTSIFDTRWSNTIAYVSPSFSGLTGTVAYVANENRTPDAANGTAAQLKTYGYDLGANYTNGPILAGLTYNKAIVGNVADTTTSDLRLAGSYNFGVASLRALWEQTKLNNNAGVDAKQIKYGIGGTYNVTSAGAILAQYYRANNVTGASGGNNSGAKLFELGYQHNLSKRTALKATYAQISNDTNANFDFGVNAVGINGAAGNGFGAKVSGVQLGLRHSF